MNNEYISDWMAASSSDADYNDDDWRSDMIDSYDYDMDYLDSVDYDGSDHSNIYY